MGTSSSQKALNARTSQRLDREEAIAREERESVARKQAGRLTDMYQSVYRQRSLFGDTFGAPLSLFSAPNTTTPTPPPGFGSGIVAGLPLVSLIEKARK